MTTTAPLTDAGVRLRNAVSRVTSWLLDPSRVADYLALGITAERVDEVGRLAEHAIAVQSAVTTGGSLPISDAMVGQDLLLAVVGALRAAPATPVRPGDPGDPAAAVNLPAVLRWAAVLASEPDQARSQALAADLSGQIARWQDIAEDAPLAYAAGLTPDEAHKAVQAGTSAPDALRTLAAVRGCHLPAGF